MSTSPVVPARSRRAVKPDPACVAAVEEARTVLVAEVGATAVGDHLGYEAEAERVVTHFFAARMPGYRGWRWAVTVSRASRGKAVTVDESVLLPGAEALVSPEWLPWSERVRPGDLGPGNLLPTAPDDDRLVPGWTAADEGVPTPDDVLALVAELGLGRERVLSVEGRDLAAARWFAGDGGPDAEIAQQAPGHCRTCGFAVRLAGPLGQAFAVCANEHAPRDGAVVAFDYGCGAHSMVVEPTQGGNGALPAPVLDTLGYDPIPRDHHDDAAPPAVTAGGAGDPYGAAALRQAVLDAWTGSPTRFREDANLEEDLARGSYRDRVVVELAQNAADAALAGGRPGRLLLRLTGDHLVAANTGTPLDEVGASALASLRASAKRGDRSVGRFGVGFAAVRAVSDDVTLRSDAGALAWSAERTRTALAGVPGLAAEVAARGDALPVLRLPYATDDAPPVPDGHTTAVTLRLRDAAARDLVAALLDDIDDALLLVLPGLAEVEVHVDGAWRRLTAAADGDDLVVTASGVDGASRRTRWRRVRAEGPLDPALLRHRPVEERGRTTWSVAVAVPLDTQGRPGPLPPGLPAVLHAPTPTDEPVTLPALVVASVPLEPSRRRAAPGPLLDAVLQEAAGAYASLVSTLPADRALLSLVPGPLPDGPVDGVLAAAVLAALRTSAWLPAAGDPDQRLRPDRASTVPAARSAARPEVLSDLVADLVDPGCWDHPTLRRLGVSEVDLAEVLDALLGSRRPPAQWRDLYAALDGADPEALGAIPVPLVDGRVVRGARGVLVPGEDLPALDDGARLLGLRLVDPAAVHPLLLRLGAVPADAARVLDEPAVRAAVEQAGLEDDLQLLAETVLSLLAAAPDLAVRERHWLAALPLRDEEGEAAPAGELVLPGSPAQALFEPDAVAPVAADLVDRWGADVLARAGVLARPALLRDGDLPLDAGTGDALEDRLDDAAAWVGEVTADLPAADVPPLLVELLAVRDLDLVRPGAWPAALRVVGDDPDLRAAVLGPAHVLVGSRRLDVSTYTAWWLARHVRIDGRALGEFRSDDADPALHPLFPVLDLPGVDRRLLDAVGVRRSPHPGMAGDLLGRLADPSADVDAATLDRLLRAIAGAEAESVEPPEYVRVPAGRRTRVVPAAGVLVADAPYWSQLGLPALLPVRPDVAPAVADLLDVHLAIEEVDPVLAPGTVADVPSAVALVLPSAPRTYREHDDLVVAGVSVHWWVDDETVHAATTEGLARGLAWAAGRWEARLLVAEVLRDPARADDLDAEERWLAQPESSAGPV